MRRRPGSAPAAGRRSNICAQDPLFHSAEFAPLTARAQRNLDTLIASYA